MTIHRRALATGLTCLALSACASSQSDGNNAVVVTLGDAGRVIDLVRGQVLDVRLYLDEGTGCLWRVERSGRLRRLQPQGAAVGREGRPLPSTVRRGGVVQVFDFRSEKRGEDTLVFLLAPARGGADAALQTVVYRLRVK